jgi:hypothetical protein
MALLLLNFANCLSQEQNMVNLATIKVDFEVENFITQSQN